MSCSFSNVLKTPTAISDHDAPIAFLECPMSDFKSFKREIWLYDRADKSKFAEKLDEIDWNTMLPESKTTNEMCECFTIEFLKIAKKCIPTKIVTVRHNDKHWFNNDIRHEIRIRDRLRKKAIKSNCENNIMKYKKQRNKVNNMKKIAKENFETNLDCLISKQPSNSKTYWKLMKR